MARRRLLEDLPAAILHSASADVLFYVLCAAAGDIGRIPGQLSTYRVHPDGITHTPAHQERMRWLANRLGMYRALQDYLHPHGQADFERVTSQIRREVLHLLKPRRFDRQAWPGLRQLLKRNLAQGDYRHIWTVSLLGASRQSLRAMFSRR
jgi:hypothetical protein